MHTHRVYTVSMTARIHIPIDEAAKARYKRQAEREGKSLAAWLREAAEDRLRAAAETPRLDSADALRSFFEECDAREAAPEPDWEEQRSLIERSRLEGVDPT